jgi:calcium/calmodulin-dependent protein kinase I
MFWGDRDALKDEIGNLKDLRQGPNITQLYEYFEVDTYCYLVMELLLGGELFDKILDMKTFTETEARNCCQCVLSALDYMHERRVAHRDLKPENLLLAVRNHNKKTVSECFWLVLMARDFFSHNILLACSLPWVSSLSSTLRRIEMLCCQSNWPTLALPST